jgi:hypothetical protein
MSFPLDGARRDGRYPYCCLCHRGYQASWRRANPELTEARQLRSLERARAWREAHPEEYRRLRRRASLIRRYGITPEHYGAMLESQGGHCALCPRRPEDEKHGVLHVDHDHSCCGPRKACSACVRALLCFNHNALLGNAHEDPDLLRRAADFLEHWHAMAAEERRSPPRFGT